MANDSLICRYSIALALGGDLTIKRQLLVNLLCACLLCACGANPNYAPVRNAWMQPHTGKNIHIVRKKETLYAIAWRYDMDFRDLAKINKLRAPYHLNVGQKIYYRPITAMAKTTVISPSKSKKSQRSVSKSRKSLSNSYSSYRKAAVKHWYRPAKGRIIKKFSPNKGAKGIDIAGTRGASVRAAASGRVAYSGSGIRGYGNLLIIKHNDTFLSAYAHNHKLLVKEGQVVRAGQKVAEMGSTGTRSVKLHFEIRKAGKPVDPLRYLRHG